MLVTLRIKNLALVTDLTLELEAGLNVITGETGAGKSVIIGALKLILGERADRTLIRSGEESCTVEATFNIHSHKAIIAQFLDEQGLEPCEEDQLILKRTFSSSGTNRQFINGSPTTLSALGRVGEGLVDMHGPHDHQSLLQSTRQLDLLDSYGQLASPVAQISQLCRKRDELLRQRSELVMDERTYAQQLDLLRFQVQEIKLASLEGEDEERLTQEYQRASNAAHLLQLTQTARDLLSDQDQSLINQAGQLGRLLQDLVRIDSSTADLQQLHEQAVEGLHEIQAYLSHYADRIDADPARMEELETRLTLIQSLKRKYGGTLEEVKSFGIEAEEKLARLEGREHEVRELESKIASTESALWDLAVALSAQRKKVAPKLARQVTEQLTQLGFKQSHFSMNITRADREPFLKSPSPRGADQVEFMFAPNPGEPPRPLRAIASSGEMSRVMLALKTVLAAEDQVPVLVFDEVDANVGGETAQVVGEKMATIAQNRQVLCITHLAPVAASARAHYCVSKDLEDGRTVSSILRLDRQARVREVARMLGGQSAAARQHAEALLGKSGRS